MRPRRLPLGSHKRWLKRRAAQTVRAAGLDRTPSPPQKSRGVATRTTLSSNLSGLMLLFPLPLGKV